MSVITRSVILSRMLYRIAKCNRKTSFKCFLNRRYSDSSKGFLLFDDVVQQRRSESQRSLVVQVHSEHSFGELYNYCSKYAEVKEIHHYKNSKNEHFMLVEFTSKENLQDVIKSCSTHQKDVDVMPVNSPFVWFRAASGKKEKNPISNNIELASKVGTELVNEDALLDELMKCATVSEQIQMLYDRTVLNDLGIRLRYMVARQLEMMFESLYSNIIVRPFGSSVNGFGRAGCDLDLVLTNVIANDTNPNEKRLVFQEKRCEGRSSWQRHMELFADLLEARVVGAARVLRILNARVPIVKYTHELTGVDCDLCYNNISGVYMSELLWLYGTMDPRVRSLTFVVRRWAKAVELTNTHPGRWITNFPLTLMVLFFLQQKSKDGVILPSLNYLIRSAGKNDIRIAEDNINCTFLRDINKLPITAYANNPASLEELLLKFFEFYAQFDFSEKAISINEGKAIRKPNNSPLYIVNPLEQSLNVSRNVSYEECERLKTEVRNAAWHVETAFEGNKSNDWGILNLIERPASRSLKKLIRNGNSQRLVSVKDLFNDGTNGEDVNELRNKLESLTSSQPKKNDKAIETDATTVTQQTKNTEQNSKLKNEQVRREVGRIRRNKMV